MTTHKRHPDGDRDALDDAGEEEEPHDAFDHGQDEADDLDHVERQQHAPPAEGVRQHPARHRRDQRPDHRQAA